MKKRIETGMYVKTTITSAKAVKVLKRRHGKTVYDDNGLPVYEVCIAVHIAQEFKQCDAKTKTIWMYPNEFFKFFNKNFEYCELRYVDKKEKLMFTNGATIEFVAIENSKEIELKSIVLENEKKKALLERNEINENKLENDKKFDKIIKQLDKDGLIELAMRFKK